MRQISDELITFAVYVHVESNGTGGQPLKEDGGWSCTIAPLQGTYKLLEDLENLKAEAKE